MASPNPAVVPPGTTTLPDLYKMPFYIQQGDGGGTASLAEIMTYLGQPMAQANIDKAIRRDDTYVAPEDMIQFARDNGLEAEEYNNGTWDQVKAMIDSGHPVQAAISTDISSSGNLGGDALRYINITGYGTDPTTGQEYITYHDPLQGTEQRMSVSDFEKTWGAVGGGYKNYFQAYGPPGSHLPQGTDSLYSNANSGLQGRQGALNGVANILNGWDRWAGPGNQLPSFLHGVLQVGGAIPQAFVCFGGEVLQLGAGWLHDKVDQIPVLRNVVQPVTDLVSGAGAAIADVGNAFGESMDALGGGLEDLVHGDGRKALRKLGDAAKDLGSGVAHAAVDTVSEIGHSVADFFSGW
jgi:hypothetical protein